MFDWIITGIIILQAIALAVEATPLINSAGEYYQLLEVETFSLNPKPCDCSFHCGSHIENDRALSKTTKLFPGSLELLRFCNHCFIPYDCGSVFNNS